MGNGGGKRRKSASFDMDVFRRLDNDVDNISRLLNDLAREYFSTGDTRSAAIAVRKAEIDHEISEAREEIARQEARIERLREEKADLKDVESKHLTKLDEAAAEIVDRVARNEMQPEYIDSDNPVIKKLAGQAGVTPEQLAERITDELSTVEG